MKMRYAVLVGFGLMGVLAFTAPRADAADYVVVDQVTFNTFLAGIGGTGFWASGNWGYVSAGTLPAGSTLTIGGNFSLRPQTPGSFTNQGTITINSTGRGFYGAGTFTNEGTFNIVAADTPANYYAISNAGLFQTAVSFDNYGTFINRCNQGTVVGTISVNAPTSDCPVPAQPMTWGRLKVRYGI